ncbi:cobalamin B12-binding domain-containing protein [Actinomadura sp. WMMA1423]|uniref:cobalamin B12-binding domain-containing protein n=1 Tax=Actinomadura sp. WMMA1423 TaxID=2591108 RepID=UPI0011462E0C|nr:cobalamin-dependent protein [Actinomadura sp. WMMA1423]
MTVSPVDATGRPAAARGTVVVGSVPSDAHTWNLVFLQLLIEELGYTVVNLGPCTPEETLVEACERTAPVMVVISSVNGHGGRDGLRLIERLRARDALAATPVVIGGQLDTRGADTAGQVAELLAAGYDAVFAGGAAGTSEFRDLLAALPEPARTPVGPEGGGL